MAFHPYLSIKTARGYPVLATCSPRGREIEPGQQSYPPNPDYAEVLTFSEK